MHARKACNANPTSTYPRWNAHHMLIELFKGFECVGLGKNRCVDLEQHGLTPVD